MPLTRGGAALIEQGLVSGAHLLAFVLFARALPASTWGVFGMAHAIVLFAQGFQRAWVTIPMIPYSAGGSGWASQRPAWLARHSLLLLAALLLLGAASAGAAAARAGWLVQSLALSTLLAAPLLVQEFARRAAVQEARWRLLAAMGCLYAVTLLAATLALRGQLAAGAWAPTLAMSLAAGASALLYAATARLPLLSLPARTAQAPHQPPAGYRQYGAWATLCHLGHAGYNFGVQAMLAAWSGPAAVGAFHACRTLVQPVATLAGALDGIDKPQAAAALAAQGPAAMRRVLRRSSGLAMLLAVPYLLGVALAAAPLLQWLYAERYAGQGPAVWLWCLVAMCSLLAQPVESGLYVARRTRTLFQVRTVAALASLTTAAALVPAHGTPGALASMALGFALAATLGALSLRRLAPS